MELHPRDLHCLRAAVGWLELGNAVEALVELDAISQAMQLQAHVLETRWLALARLERWALAAQVGRALIGAAPDSPTSWLNHAYALRRSPKGGLLAAFNALAPAAKQFPKESTIPYNLACYSCQMQRDAAETMSWLREALTIGGRKRLLAMALKDPDLEPLRSEIARLAKKP